jgi:hypothetical protein
MLRAVPTCAARADVVAARKLVDAGLAALRRPKP